MDRLLPALTKLGLDAEVANSERVGPLLYFASPRSARALRRVYYESAARNVALLDALAEVRAGLAARGIVPVALKGADLATSLYPNVALRPMSDLDLWVDGGEVAAAEQALRKLGYRPGCPEMTPGLQRAVRHARPFVGGVRDTIAIDLHWSLVGHDRDRRAPELGWFRRRAHDGRLDVTAHLLYLAAHLKLQHYDERPPLLWLCDFHLLSQREDLDWDELVRAARDFGWIDALAATASEVEERLCLPAPEPLRALSIVPSRAAGPIRKGGPRRAWNELSTLDWKGRAALARGYLLPSPSYLRWRYRPRPEWIWPIYYAVRWARLIRSGFSLVFSVGPAGRARGVRPLLGSRA
jgi:hypothetical protein